MTSPANTSDRETGTVERLVARAEGMNGAMKAGGLYLRLGDYTDEDAALDREAASELTRLKARAESSEAKLATAREALEGIIIDAQGSSNAGCPDAGLEAIFHRASDTLRIITEGADHERS